VKADRKQRHVGRDGDGIADQRKRAPVYPPGKECSILERQQVARVATLVGDEDRFVPGGEQQRLLVGMRE
jgi:hypothetical protein